MTFFKGAYFDSCRKPNALAPVDFNFIDKIKKHRFGTTLK